MTNIEYKVVGTTLTITVDLSKTFGRSKSGKTETVASTNGNIVVCPSPDGKHQVSMGVNVYQK